MRAITQKSFGGPDVLETVEAPRPVPQAGEVLVRVAATSVNPADWKLRSGALPHSPELPITLGFDVSGTVAELGPGVTAFAPGDEVFGMLFSAFGAYAEYVAVPADSLAAKPADLDHVHAAALPVVALTGWQALTELRAGQRVLIHAAAGGVGHLAVQFAKARGAYVIGTARAVNHEFLRGLGADELIDYTAVDFTTAVRDVDVVLDLIGGDYGSRSLTVLRPGGAYLDTQGSDAENDPRYVRIYVQPSGSDLRAVLASGPLHIEVERVMSLADVAEAHKLSESGRVRGKIVLVPWEAPTA
ncbi:NADPH:quinone reductase-like Zn-dependent oxidoreductase [Nocardia transvalensis]|uniref:NADPH:quinone reductase-like Zn-dependent oxidoreductase n=1 Tax=Nocardia transvalensis TaxID=37333 RepID=A0A7W9PAR5_9NOCA|nr:NADP-dependent oxidoreductase [Nocardia transvalensis]MBB5912641.1 NADPH:quinone reductase-like Zn-dependent oxidoreductase [Nocardia transvalensis]